MKRYFRLTFVSLSGVILIGIIYFNFLAAAPPKYWWLFRDVLAILLTVSALYYQSLED
ncbi:hypothetical protein [Mucilaginibacter flavidus]|uniref:hypothetical protein n=1 Tax=Mucilaginibacter flavidus TaxID=2949309 RepID=UPI00209220D8|nr:hypothetical protein [Mucilaginibacter flavidus]